MKTVYLLRHAKSSWEDPSLADFARPLADRGESAATRMGKYMKREGLVPDAVLCSGATRANQTWERVAPFVGEPRVHIDDNLYMATPDAILNWLRRLQADIDSVLLIGHNPGFEELARRLAGSGSKKALKRLQRKYPTCALAMIQFDGEGWPAVEDGAGRLDRFVRPKDL